MLLMSGPVSEFIPVIFEWTNTPLFPSPFGLEFQFQLEIPIGFLCGQVSVFVGRSFAKDRTALRHSAFCCVYLPNPLDLSEKQGNPLGLQTRLPTRSEQDESCEQGNRTAFHKSVL
jgi:hypothetical protein